MTYPIFRTHPKFPTPTTMNFVVVGGLGDMVCYMSAIEWIARTFPHVQGRLYTFPFFMPIAQNILAPYRESWSTHNKTEFTAENPYPTLASLDTSAISPVGANLVDLGYMYFANTNPPHRGGFAVCG